MKLSELKIAVDDAIERAKEYGYDDCDIDVSLQIGLPGGTDVWAKDDVELCYDMDSRASGCVLVAEFGGLG